jgi:sulfonate transport system substrate-binding protein
VDAWVIWDPYEAAAEASTGARILADGTGLVSNYQFYFSSKDFLAHNPRAVDVTLEALTEVDEWTRSNIEKVAELLSPSVGLPAPVIARSLQRESYGIKPISDDVIASQQKIADTFLGLGLLPKSIKVSDAQRKPGS